jgi:hypothetical protein
MSEFIKSLSGIQLSLSSSELIESRRSICYECDRLKGVGTMSYCGTCKCPIISKIRIFESKCPLNKW